VDLEATLYLAEYITGSDEDLPSIARLARAMKMTGITLSSCHADICFPVSPELLSDTSDILRHY
jgi:hypothetical protein